MGGIKFGVSSGLLRGRKALSRELKLGAVVREGDAGLKVAAEAIGMRETIQGMSVREKR